MWNESSNKVVKTKHTYYSYRYRYSYRYIRNTCTVGSVMDTEFLKKESFQLMRPRQRGTILPANNLLFIVVIEDRRNGELIRIVDELNNSLELLKTADYFAKNY